MLDLNKLKLQGWLTDHQIVEKHGTSNPSLMRKIIKGKGEDFQDDRKIVIRRKNGNNDYIYSPVLVSKILAFFTLESYYFAESKKDSLKKEDCYSSKELAKEFHTTQSAIIEYVESEGLCKTGLIKECEEGILIHKDLYCKIQCHFLSYKKMTTKCVSFENFSQNARNKSRERSPA